MDLNFEEHELIEEEILNLIIATILVLLFVS